MSNLAAVLKKEISRLARKEIRAASASDKKANAKLRSEVADLKRRVKQLESQLSAFQPQRVTPLASPAAVAPSRISAKSIRSHRKRLGFSAESYAKILGVSMQTVYHWEQGKSRPRQSQLLRLTAVRQMGKREARAQLAALATTKAKVAKKPAESKKSAAKSAKKSTKKSTKKAPPKKVAPSSPPNEG